MLRDRLHGHECPRCETVWEHHPDDFHNDVAFDEAHICPACKYDGPQCRDCLPPRQSNAQIELYRAILGL